MSAEEAAEGLRYFVNAKKARHFVEMGTVNLACPACGDDGINPACENFSALVALGHPRADEWMGLAWDDGASESPWAEQRGAPAARRTGVATYPVAEGAMVTLSMRQPTEEEQAMLAAFSTLPREILGLATYQQNCIRERATINRLGLDLIESIAREFHAVLMEEARRGVVFIQDYERLLNAAVGQALQSAAPFFSPLSEAELQMAR